MVGGLSSVAPSCGRYPGVYDHGHNAFLSIVIASTLGSFLVTGLLFSWVVRFTQSALPRPQPPTKHDPQNSDNIARWTFTCCF